MRSAIHGQEIAAAEISVIRLSGLGGLGTRRSVRKTIMLEEWDTGLNSSRHHTDLHDIACYHHEGVMDMSDDQYGGNNPNHAAKIDVVPKTTVKPKSSAGLGFGYT